MCSDHVTTTSKIVLAEKVEMIILKFSFRLLKQEEGRIKFMPFTMKLVSGRTLIIETLQHSWTIIRTFLLVRSSSRLCSIH